MRKPKAKEPKVAVFLRLDAADVAKLRKRAEAERTTLAHVIRQIIGKALANRRTE